MKRIMKMFSIAVMSAAMIMTMIPLSAFAADDHVIQVDDDGVTVQTEDTIDNDGSTSYKCKYCDSTDGYLEYDDDECSCVYKDQYYHTIKNEWYCCDCYEYTPVSYTEKHSLYDGVCKYCTYPTKDLLLKSGEWARRSGRPWLRIVVPAEGYIKVESVNDYQCFYFYNNEKKLLRKIRGNNSFRVDSDDPEYIVVPKGTYYIRNQSTHSHNNYKIRYTFKATTNKKNYTKGTAVTLSKGVTTNYIIRPTYSKGKDAYGSKTWCKWYKIKLTKKSRIYLYSRQDVGYLYNSSCSKDYDLDEVSTNSKTGVIKYVSDKVLPAGTYYICDYHDWSYVERQRTYGTYNSIMWTYK